MAAPVAAMAGSSEGSSSSDDEQLKRCQEAVWDSQVLQTKDASNNKKPSKRLVVADHEHDGNELQVTQGFQTHVAKKLGLILDSLISEKHSSALPSVNTEKDDDKDEDKGFRLFSTSVPGQKTEEPPPPKRRPISSSSDSDSEMEARLKEAAVSIKDLLPSSTSALSNNSAGESSNLETKEKVKKKKKKKRKLNEEENDEKNSKSINDIQKNSDNQEEAPATVKLKKKKKKKATSENSEGEVLS